MTEKCAGIKIELIEWAIATSGVTKFWESSELGEFISIISPENIPLTK